MLKALRTGSGPDRSLVAASLVFFAVSSSLMFWLVTDLDRISPEVPESMANIAGLEDPSAGRSTVQRTRLGIFALGSTSVLFVIGLIAAYHSSWRRMRRHLAEVFRQALEGDPEEDEHDEHDDPFDGSLDSVRRLARAMRAQRHDSTIDRARLTKLADLMDVGVLIFDADRKPELASAAALRFLRSPGPMPEPALVEQIFETFEDEHGELPDQAKADLEIAADPAPVRLRLQLLSLDEACDHGYVVLVRSLRLLAALDTDLRLATQQRAMTRLYLGIAHDLKAPLNAIGLNLALLRDSLTHEDSAEDRQRSQWLNVVERELTRVRRETERLLAQAAPSREEVSTYDLGAVLTGIRDLLAPQARQQHSIVELILPDRPVLVCGREDLVKQALLNVALNALEATPEGERVLLAVRAEKGLAFVRIADRGPGIPEVHQGQIFEIHFTTKEHGTGIGLYIARSILEAEGGTLVLKESSADGTVLESTLPLV